MTSPLAHQLARWLVLARRLRALTTDPDQLARQLQLLFETHATTCMDCGTPTGPLPCSAGLCEECRRKRSRKLALEVVQGGAEDEATGGDAA